jgi:hypothetical protein
VPFDVEGQADGSSDNDVYFALVLLDQLVVDGLKLIILDKKK